MNRRAFPIRFLGVVGAAVLLALLLAGPAGAHSFVLQTTPEPEPRETPTTQPSPTITPSVTPTPTSTPVPYIEVQPLEAYGNRPVKITVTGHQWPTGGPGVNLFWDLVNGDYWLTGPIPPDSGGWWSREVTVKKAWATIGEHRIIAVEDFGPSAEGRIVLVEPPPEPDTPTPTTPTATTTPTPSPTLRPVTPMVTITPIPPTKAPPAAATQPPAPTRTSSPIPGTSTPTVTPTTTATPSDTPGPGTPSATPENTSTPTSTPTPTATPVEEISDTGVGWGTFFLWGFVLAGLLVVFRLLRVRGLHESS